MTRVATIRKEPLFDWSRLRPKKRSAVKDMEATRDYIAGRLKNPKAAKKLMTTLLKAISLLADNPYMGAALAEKFEIATDVRYFVVSKQLFSTMWMRKAAR